MFTFGQARYTIATRYPTLSGMSTLAGGAAPGDWGITLGRSGRALVAGHAIGAVFFFQVAHYALRPWPWILVALSSLVVFPTVGDIQAAFPSAMNVANDSGYSAIRHQREVGAGYFDEVSQVISGGTATTLALSGSTEAEQF